MVCKIYKNCFNTTVRGHCFLQRIINGLNGLPPDIVSVSNAKAKLDLFVHNH